MSPFSIKDWRNANNYAGGGDTSTPLSALAIEDVETRLSEYTDSVALGGIELGRSQITTTFTGTATTLTDITGLTVTVDTGLRPILVRFGSDSVASTAGFTGGVYLNEDGVDLGAMVVATSVGARAGERERNPAPGTHTYKLRYNQASAGTFTLLAGLGNGAATNGPAYISILEV